MGEATPRIWPTVAEAEDGVGRAREVERIARVVRVVGRCILVVQGERLEYVQESTEWRERRGL